MVSMLTGQSPDFEAVGSIDAFNGRVVTAWHDRSLHDLVTELQDARGDWLSWLRQVPLEAFLETRQYEGWDWSFPSCLEVQWQHDAEHASEIASWRQRTGVEETFGPKEVLLAALDTARAAFLAAAALVPVEEQLSLRVCGDWTLKDVVGHLADWEWVGVQGLRHMAAGQSPRVEFISDIDAWNQTHAAARRDQAWDDVWRGFQAARGEFQATLTPMGQTKLAESFRFPWGPEGTAYDWVRVYVTHDREHAEGLMVAMGVEPDRKGLAQTQEVS